MTENTSTHEYTASNPLLKDLPLNLRSFPRWVLLAFIRLYQFIISPLIPADTCRFYPTCSHYGYQAVYKHGIFTGGWMAIKRVFRCNPFNPGGYDPVP